jgi:hypothetical protein
MVKRKGIFAGKVGKTRGEGEGVWYLLEQRQENPGKKKT